MSRVYQEKRFEYKGYPCVVLFQGGGYRCGYVGLPKENEYYNVDYDNIDIDCHGGLTYSESFLYGQADRDTWWIGFDCAHYFDKNDWECVKRYFLNNEGLMEYIKWHEEFEEQSFGYGVYKEIRTLDYVVKECKNIVDQLEEGAK